MPGSMFIRLGDSINGEASEPGYEQQIEMTSFAWGLSRPTGGRPSGAAIFSDFAFTKRVDSASPDIFLYCAAGRPIDRVEIAVLQSAGGSQPPYLQFELGDVIITSCQVSGSADADRAVESVSLNYGTCRQIYTPISATGAPGSPLDRGWNLLTNSRL
jgi:type VI secretion system secreted protein Hcp